MKLGGMSWICKIETPVIKTTPFVIGSFSHDDEILPLPWPFQPTGLSPTEVPFCAIPPGLLALP